MDESFISSDTYTESLVKAKKTKKLNKKALVSFLLILVVAIGVAAYVTLKFLGNHHILCEEAQYLN